eukprot:c20040_g2_i1.p2 GENE.c20040_g2_i1~~c20040_g2_i1.p2  ORF type:complete len:194 (-),score=33.40 c20040_g2_i1:319-900(-)
MAARQPTVVLLMDLFRMHVVCSTGWFVADVFNPLRASSTAEQDLGCVTYAVALSEMLVRGIVLPLEDAEAPDSDGEEEKGAGGAQSDDDAAAPDGGVPADDKDAGENDSAGDEPSSGQPQGRKHGEIWWDDPDETREEIGRYRRAEIRARQAEALQKRRGRAPLTLQTLSLHNQEGGARSSCNEFKHTIVFTE